MVLQELQREVRVKEKVLRQSVQALTDVVSERETILTQPEQVLYMEGNIPVKSFDTLILLTGAVQS